MDQDSTSSVPPEILTAVNLSQVIADAGQPLTILQSINLSIRAGESVAIVGASGSGKSTLLGLLAGLDLPTSGDVLWQGEAINRWSEDARAAWRATQVGFVFQSFQLLGHLTALENVLLPLELMATGQGLNARQGRERALALLAQVGLAERGHHFPKQLSGGEQQRVALARAFMMQPRLLFADEPTGSLDEHAAARVIDLLFEINQAQGTTLVLVTHDRRLAERCQRQFRLQAGQLAGATQPEVTLEL
ncbi:ABC transporter ATP-binding protein [Parvibium lacunae]|uniref:ABC transporter ATP-binding protein n=1 Tax=Parvibium lacunae TaxID=1888893 RepID=A0A368L8F7_9BURK|nr:ABC transporter ATP-binding protein [Parvibium lacunae]RCS59801.1 ABC transporter ATP-binding protein [Parvibium lacunae]